MNRIFAFNQKRNELLIIKDTSGWNTFSPALLFVCNLTADSHTLTVNVRDGQCEALVDFLLDSLAAISWMDR